MWRRSRSSTNAGNALNYRRKNTRKAIRSVIQALVLLVVVISIVEAVLHLERYDEPDRAEWSNRDGFVALSYFGVSRSGSPTLIAKGLLDKHLEALKKEGYVTVSQQDVLDFYFQGKPLPEKALFLSFEDGRNDSAIFSQPLLEKYHYKATILSYANMFGSNNRKFLQPDDLLKMNKTGYWELGSNGYRLTYMNIFNKNKQFVGVRDEIDFQVEEAETYNHYLMDFIRDENGVPVENRTEMEERVTYDYGQMKQIYTEQLGFVPKVYMIMHANSLYNGMNRLVEDINDRHIRSLFGLHFNREGDAYNNSRRSVYDLTRVQAAPHWTTNHLLMKLQLDTGQPVTFVTGEEKRARDWQLKGGAAEFDGHRILLTSPPHAEALLYLKGSEVYGADLKLGVNLGGIPEGKQSVYVRYDASRGSYLRLVMENNELTVYQKKASGQEEQMLGQAQADTQRNGTLDVEIKGTLLNASVGGVSLLENVEVDASLNGGGIALSAEPVRLDEEEQLHDDIYYKGNEIYDGRFSNFVVHKLDSQTGESEQVYSNAYNGLQKAVHLAGSFINRMIDWAIETL